MGQILDFAPRRQRMTLANAAVHAMFAASVASETGDHHKAALLNRRAIALQDALAALPPSPSPPDIIA